MSDDLTEFRKSSHSGQNNECVEVAAGTDWVGIRDSKLGVDSPILMIGAAEWRALITRLQA